MNPDMTIEEIRAGLSEREITELEFRMIGGMILNKSRELSQKVSEEILKPISIWLNDKDFVSKWKNPSEEPDWAAYKRDQREWNLRAAWEAIRIKREREKQVRELLKESAFSRYTSPQNDLCATMEVLPLSAFLAPFSPQAQAEDDLNRQFEKPLERSMFWLMPWPPILSVEIGTGATFSALPTHPDKTLAKKIKIAKYQHALHMAHEGKITLSQEKPFGEIILAPLCDKISDPEGSLKIMTKDGESLDRCWTDLSDAQRNKVIADSINGIILCHGA
jgi:hypothetical protein